MAKTNKNLILLGVGAFVISIITTGISLFVYHESGDIYLDRSRPGFLPEKSEETEDEEVKDDYSFSENGVLTPDVVTEYLEHLSKEQERLSNYPDNFSEASLSDNSIGIPTE